MLLKVSRASWLVFGETSSISWNELHQPRSPAAIWNFCSAFNTLLLASTCRQWETTAGGSILKRRPAIYDMLPTCLLVSSSCSEPPQPLSLPSTLVLPLPHTFSRPPPLTSNLYLGATLGAPTHSCRGLAVRSNVLAQLIASLARWVHTHQRARSNAMGRY